MVSSVGWRHLVPSSLWAPFLCLGQSDSGSRPISCVELFLSENDSVKFRIFSKSWIISAENRAHWSASRDASFSPANRRASFLLSSVYEKILEIPFRWIFRPVLLGLSLNLTLRRGSFWKLVFVKSGVCVRASCFGELERRNGGEVTFSLSLGLRHRPFIFLFFLRQRSEHANFASIFLISGEDELYATLVAILKVKCVSFEGELILWSLEFLDV